MKEALKKAFPYTIPVIIGYTFLGLAFGIMLSQQGFSAILAPILSLTVYAGSMQFVLIPLLKTDISLLGIAILTLSVNFRMMFYGVSLLKEYKNSRSKFLFILTLSDETFALDTSIKPPEDVDDSDFYFAIGLINYGVRALASYLGGLLGDMISFNSAGLDFVLTALFLVLLVEQFSSTKNHRPFFIGISLSTLALILFGKDNFMIPALLLIVLSLIGFRGKVEDYNE
ncbi:AzlC family ABC transporter permease [Anaerococcus sp. AGMB09787]|uniref:AzlC family ABC transporter permease n=1 Tax=Anaerococcus sp. AGMB09787 TaxID=2922869 RepID=UPI001FB02E92|nr:AzlC family ABC transporter permease [Anaerococcus sp. AGMB09787]